MSTSKKGRGRTGGQSGREGRCAPATVTGAVDVDCRDRGRNPGDRPRIAGPAWSGAARRSSSAAGGTTASSPGPWPTNRSRCRCSASSTCCPCCARTRRSPAICRSISTRSAPTCRWAVRLGLEISQPNSVLGKALALNARTNAMRMSQRFIAGAKVEEVLQAVTRLRKQGFAFTLDLLGEATTSERDADAYQRAYLNLIEGLAGEVQSWPEVARLDRDHEGTDSAGQSSRSSSRPFTASSARSTRPARPQPSRPPAAPAARPRGARRLHPRRHGAVRVQGPDARRSSKRS